MSLLADIVELEQAVAELIGQVNIPGQSDARLRQAAVDAIFALLDEAGYTAADLDTPEAQQQILDALAEVFPDWSAQLRRDIAARVSDVVELVEAFYKTQGVNTVGLREAAQRSTLAQALSESLESGFGSLQQKLADATVVAIRDQILSGSVDRTALASSIEAATDTTTRFARIQAQAAVGGLNQTYREQTAIRAGLTHYHYYGSVQNNTRPFCRIHIGYVFPVARVEQMRNGMLEPVRVFKGGFNCRHSWLPVDPSWSVELASKIVDEEPTRVATTVSGNRPIVVVASEGRIARLVAQIPLQAAGYLRFWDAETNESGFVAVHEDWHDARLAARGGSKARKAFDDQFDQALRDSEAGEQVKLRLVED